jgi:hypothetical protein
MPSLMGLEDREFWSDPRKATDPFIEKLLDTGFAGVRIDAPAAVALDTQTTLPVVCIRSGSYRDVWTVDFAQHGLLATVNLDENKLLVDFAVDQEMEDEKIDPAEAPEGYTAQTRVIDIREQLGLPWQPGRLLTTAIMRERVSNRVMTAIQHSPSAYRDEEVEKFIAAQRARVPASPIRPLPGKFLPYYRPSPGSPPLPEQAGIRVQADRVLVLRPGAQCIVRGSFRLPVLIQEVVKSQQYPAPEFDPGNRPTAVVGIHILITGAEVPAANVLEMSVPSYEPLETMNGKRFATGYFTLDLIQHGIVSNKPQTIFLYIFSGEVLVGPTPIGLVSEDRLPH